MNELATQKDFTLPTVPKLGRPTVMTPAIVSKIEQAYMLGATDTEACLFANLLKTKTLNLSPLKNL